MAIQAIIVDDEELARNRLKYLLQAEPDIEVAAECKDGRAAVEAILAGKPDLLFLDVQMPEMDGFEVLKAIGEERRPTIIFVTAFDE